MILVTAGIVYGIINYKKRLEGIYSQFLMTDETLVAGSSGESGAGRGAASTLLRSARPELANDIFNSVGFTEDCKGYVAEVQKLDLIELERNHYKLSYQLVPKQPEVCRFVDASMNQMIQDLSRTCKPTANDSEAISEKCASSLFRLRAAMTRQMYHARPLSTIRDMRVLTDLMFAEFATIDNTTMPDLRRAKNIADRMLELDPKLYVAAKVGAFAEVIDAMSKKQKNTSMIAEEWVAAAHAVENAKQLNPNDETLEDAEMLVKTQGFEPKLALDYSNKMIAKRSENAKAWYLKAYAEWKMGAREKAQISLTKASSLAPGNREYSQTLVEISRPNAKVDAFKGSISFGVTPGDFDN